MDEHAYGIKGADILQDRVEVMPLHEQMILARKTIFNSWMLNNS